MNITKRLAFVSATLATIMCGIVIGSPAAQAAGMVAEQANYAMGLEELCDALGGGMSSNSDGSISCTIYL